MTDETLYAEDNTYTLNSLKSILQCNRLTAEKYIAKGNYKKTSKNYNGKEFNAWIIPQNEIKRLKSNLYYMQGANDVTSKTSINKSVSPVEDITPVNTSATVEMLRNITELNGRITTLENDNRNLTKEIKELTSENTVLAREKATVESKMLLIEDKSKTIEGAYSEKVQEVKQLQATIKSRNVALIVLGAILLVFLTIVLTVIFVTKTV